MRSSSTWFVVTFLLTILTGFPAGSWAASGPASASAAPRSSNAALKGSARATFAAGCFWCAESAYEGLRGVFAVTSGFSGGPEKNPTYDQVSAGRTGHLEAVQVLYDPRRIGYARLLSIFWHNVDPTQADGQFCDHGKQYRSAIFYGSPEERKAAEASARAAAAEIRVKRPFVTEIVPFSAFYPAEEYHQDYYKKNPGHYQGYREGCGRDRRLLELWGAAAGH
jgi:peptide-methionine (S)-S-oxide reductase